MHIQYVSASLLSNNEKAYFLAKRPMNKSRPGIYELPGGKVDPGETPEQAMVRELKEELGIHVLEGDLHPVTFLSHTYDDSGHVVIFVYEIHTWAGEITLLEGQGDGVWATLDEFANYPMPEADLMLLDQLKRYCERV